MWRIGIPCHKNDGNAFDDFRETRSVTQGRTDGRTDGRRWAFYRHNSSADAGNI